MRRFLKILLTFAEGGEDECGHTGVEIQVRNVALINSTCRIKKVSFAGQCSKRSYLHIPTNETRTPTSK